MSIGWQKLRVPIMERLALADMAARRDRSEEEMLVELIREGVKADLTRTPGEVAQKAGEVSDD